MATMKFKAPGRLGNPDATVANDPRTQPALAKFLESMGMGGQASYDDVAQDIDAIGRKMGEVHGMINGLYGMIPLEIPEDKHEGEIEASDLEIDGPDGNKIKLYVTKPKGIGGPLPGLVYIHGGGQVINDTDNPVHRRWVKSIALQGLVTVMVDFRNAWTPEKYSPFPAGLNDCATAVKYVASHRSDFGISKFVVQGESGGANLSLATALKANREGWIGEISGVVGYVPYIAGGGLWPDEQVLRETPSQIENDGYFLNRKMQGRMQWYYSPGEGQLQDPLAWPYWATEPDLKGLPPHMITVDELDMLRDEGIAYFHKLLEAGVPATCSMNNGVVHGAALVFRQVVPELNKALVRNIAAFAKEVCR